VKNSIEVTALNKSYKNFSLNDLSFTVPEDCITGFIGINGAGKTTTIRTILGLAQKSSGIIKIFGKDMESSSQELKNRVGVVLDEGGFYNELNMEEMKSIIAPAYSSWNEKEYRKYMERFSLDPRQKIATLSKGMRMKYSITLALSHRAELLIMDEPTSGLDPLLRNQFLDIMKEFMKQGGKGVLFSTHITSDLDKVADMLILIHEGRILFEREKDALLDGYRLIKGDARALNSENKRLLKNIRITDFGFTGMTRQLPQVQQSMADIIVERPSIEDIMLGYIEGGDQ
jgi:ABC-type multidrug transport system, ATPase component